MAPPLHLSNNGLPNQSPADSGSMGRTWILAGLLLVPVGHLATIDRPAHDRAPIAAALVQQPAPPAASPAPPIAVTPLQSDLDGIVNRTVTRGSVAGVLAISMDRGDTIYERAPDQPLAPASNLKLLTTAAALLHLGPDYRFATYLLTDGRIVNGVLEGNLYLYGTGDPTLGIRFAQMPARQLVEFADVLDSLGVREIRGNVIGDGSYFQGPSTGHGWGQNNIEAWFAPTAGALSVHENMVRVVIRPGGRPAARPAVTLIPGGAGIAIVNLATSRGSNIRARRADFGGPIVIAGGIGSGSASYAVHVADPARYTAALFRDLLVERGIVVTGQVLAIDDADASPVTGVRVFAPAYRDGHRIAVLAVQTSVPLREILHVINHQSHNFYAEQVLRAVGRAAARDGSIEGGARVIRNLLRHAGVDPSEFHIEDGCGLSPLNRISARGFVAVLAYMARTPLAEEFYETLPVAGRVRRFRRMGGTPAEGNLRAKTGTIDGVSALSGYVTAANGEMIAFSILINETGSVAQAKYVENLIGARLASFARPGGPGRAAVVTQTGP